VHNIRSVGNCCTQARITKQKAVAQTVSRESRSRPCIARLAEVGSKRWDLTQGLATAQNAELVRPEGTQVKTNSNTICRHRLVKTKDNPNRRHGLVKTN